MIFFKITIVCTAVITLAKAWSGQFPQFYHTFPSPTPPPIAFRPFFQEPLPAQRYFVHQPQFRQTLGLYQPPTPPPTVTRPDVRFSRVSPTSSVSQQVTTTDVHHHVFYYYFYLPAKAETPTTGRRGDNDGGRVAARRPCGDHHPITTVECLPVYLPPPPPSPTPPTTQTPNPTTSVPPPPQGPCNDDSVVVDNADYYPFGRTPIAVAPAIAAKIQDSSEQKHGPKTQPNFILANYLLPPDK